MTMTYPYTLKEAVAIQQKNEQERKQYQQEQIRQQNQVMSEIAADTRDIPWEQKVLDYLESQRKLLG